MDKKPGLIAPLVFMNNETGRAKVLEDPLASVRRVFYAIDKNRELGDAMQAASMIVEELLRAPRIKIPFILGRRLLSILNQLYVIARNWAAINQALADAVVLLGAQQGLVVQLGIAEGFRRAGREDLLDQMPSETRTELATYKINADLQRMIEERRSLFEKENSSKNVT